MGDSGPAHKVGTFSSRMNDLHIREILLVVIREIARLHGVPVSIVSDRDLGLRCTFRRVSKRLWAHG